jgi:aspartyl-tRNA(Asn)/glutamyl-tRNA(Gln) amidotransferase subunit A
MEPRILQLHNKIFKDNQSIVSIVNEAILKCKEIDDTNSIITDTYESAIEQANQLELKKNINSNNLLYGVPYSLKDLVCTENIKTTGGSAFLKDFTPPYNATIYNQFNQVGAILICKSNVDEFGMGGLGIDSAFGIVKNIHDKTRITGGSSSGSVNLVAAGILPFTIGTDTGDSSRWPASLVGVVGYKPTYGLISRYGVMPYAPSLDHVGIIASTVSDIVIVADCILKYDEKDFTSQILPHKDLYKNLKIINKLNIGIIDGIEKHLEPDIADRYSKCITMLQQSGHVIKHIDFSDKLMNSIKTVYSAISYGEANSCWANLTGIPFGAKFNGDSFDDIITITRSKTLGRQVKRRFTIGAYITKKENYEKFFIYAQKIRHMLVNK